MWKTRQSLYKAVGLALTASFVVAVFASQTDAWNYGESSQRVWTMASLNWQPYAAKATINS